jgi:hypothetical protein
MSQPSSNQPAMTDQAEVDGEETVALADALQTAVDQAERELEFPQIDWSQWRAT